MKASDYVAAFLAERNVPQVFCLSGGMITHLLDSMDRLGRPRIVCMQHEQAAAFAADAVGRLTGVPGVAMATSGPGAVNLLTGIGSCHFDSSPAIFITGQVNLAERRRKGASRQGGFQETDIVAMARPVTKAAWAVESAADLPSMLDEAFALARGGRPGPVLLDIPMDIQREDVASPVAADASGSLPRSHALSNGGRASPRAGLEPVAMPADLSSLGAEIASALAAAQRPMILAGGGIRAAGACAQLRRLAAVSGIPVVNTLMAVDALPHNDTARAGLIGTYGNRWANLALFRSDLLLVLGSRLDVRQTGSDVDAFKGARAIYHVDCDPGEINNRVSGCRAVVADVRAFLEALLPRLEGAKPGDRAAWRDEIAVLRREWDDCAELRGIRGINPNAFMHALSRASQDAAVYVADVGQNQMWAAQSLDLGAEQRFMTSGGMGSMGFALPAAIGAALVPGGRPIVALAGDGGFQANIQELQTVANSRLPVKMVVLNNRSHGMVRQFQEAYFAGRHPATVLGYSAPDFVRVAEAYGIRARRLERTEDVEDALAWLWWTPAAAALLEVTIGGDVNVYPKTAFGRPLPEMEPVFPPLPM